MYMDLNLEPSSAQKRKRGCKLLRNAEAIAKTKTYMWMRRKPIKLWRHASKIKILYTAKHVPGLKYNNTIVWLA